MTPGYKLLLTIIAGILMISSTSMNSPKLPEKWRHVAQAVTIYTILAGTVVGVWVWFE